jgi:hypothetical protein
MWWRGVSLVMAIAAVVGVFVEIPIISDYAFWILVAAFIVWRSYLTVKTTHLLIMTPIALLFLAIVGVFVEIPIVSAYAFWVLAIAYLNLIALRIKIHFD